MGTFVHIVVMDVLPSRYVFLQNSYATNLKHIKQKYTLSYR